MQTLENIMKAKKVTQTELAQACGKHQTLVSQWCTGKARPTINDLKMISQTLGISVDAVLDSLGV